jgi:hypothetical protein
MSDYEVVKNVFEKSSWIRVDFHDKIDYPLDEETFVEGKAIWVWDDVVGDCVEILFDKDGNII